MIGSEESALAADVLVGAAAIARYMGLERRQVYNFVESGRLPSFRIGSLVCARRSTLTEWIERQEQVGLDLVQSRSRAAEA